MRWVIYNQKGGVGKTSISVNLAAIFGDLGYKTLLIDLDSQANSSYYLLGDRLDECEFTLTDFFESTLLFSVTGFNSKKIITETDLENLWIIPSDPSLRDIEAKLETKFKINRLKKLLDEIQQTHGFDIIIMDTPPALNFYTASALVATDKVIIPTDTALFSAQAVERVIESVFEFKEDHNPQLEVEGILLNQYNPNQKASQNIEKLFADKGLEVLNTKIPTSTKIKESYISNKPIIYSSRAHVLAKSLDALAEEILLKNSITAPVTRENETSTDL